MKSLRKTQHTVLKEIRNVKKFLDAMERSVKTGNVLAIEKAYIYLVHLCYQMNEGVLTPDNISLDTELAKLLNPQEISP